MDQGRHTAPGLIELGRLNVAGAGLVLLGTGPDFWAEFTAAPEYADGLPHPVDRWSKRVIGVLAQTLNGSCSFPSDGPPYAPFVRWAMDTGRFWQSPAGMMVHDRVGLMISIRGALHLPDPLDLPPAPVAPCSDCAAPCATACPVGALSAQQGYDVDACHAYLDTVGGQDCMTRGCIARRACPVSAGALRSDAQSALHMRAFHPAPT